MKCLLLVVVWSALVFGRNTGKREGRQDFIGGWIQNSEWFPIEVNIPDTISFIGQGLSSVGQGISTGLMQWTDSFGNFIQGIPIFNRITSQLVPKIVPKPSNKPTHIIIVPVKRDGPSGGFNPYSGPDGDFVQYYP